MYGNSDLRVWTDTNLLMWDVHICLYILIHSDMVNVYNLSSKETGLGLNGWYVAQQNINLYEGGMGW